MPSLPPWERPRRRHPSACCRGISKATVGDGGDVWAGDTEQTPLAHPSPAPRQQPGQSIPNGVTIRQHPPMLLYAPGEKTSPALQRSTPKVLWPAMNITGEPLGSAMVLPSPQRWDAGAEGMAKHVKVIPTASIRTVPTPSATKATSCISAKRLQILGEGDLMDVPPPKAWVCLENQETWWESAQ